MQHLESVMDRIIEKKSKLSYSLVTYQMMIEQDN